MMKESPKEMIGKLIINIALPVLILSKFSSADMLGPLYSALLALSFPLFYGIYELYQHKKINAFSVLGVANVLLTGVLIIFKLGTLGFALKEASIPLLISLLILLTLRRDKHVIHFFIFNDRLPSYELIMQRVQEYKQELALKNLLTKSGLFFVASFLLSAFLNFALAIILLKSEPQTEAFNAELAKMTALSFPIITVPSLVIMFFAVAFLFRGLTRLTKLSSKEIVSGNHS